MAIFNNVSCIIVNPPLNKIILEENPGKGVSIPIVKSWNLMAGMEAKEEDEEEEEKKEKKEKEKEKEDNKIGVAEKSFHYCHAWCRFVIAILGLAKGVPFVDLFSCFFNKGFIRKSAVW